jgi:hypothetical protein
VYLLVIIRHILIPNLSRTKNFILRSFRNLNLNGIWLDQNPTQSMSYDFCGDETYNYLECPLAQLDERVSQVDSANNEPPFMSNPLYEHSFMSNPFYEPHPENSPEFQKWMHGRPNSENYGSYNQNSYQNN